MPDKKVNKTGTLPSGTKVKLLIFMNIHYELQQVPANKKPDS